MKINWKVRIKNPWFWIQTGLAIFAPVMAYMGITAQELTSWSIVGTVLLEAVKNPFVLGLVAVSVWNAINDPTTAGLSDSLQALTYSSPKKKG